jgi:hypothetical protein
MHRTAHGHRLADDLALRNRHTAADVDPVSGAVALRRLRFRGLRRLGGFRRLGRLVGLRDLRPLRPLRHLCDLWDLLFPSGALARGTLGRGSLQPEELALLGDREALKLEDGVGVLAQPVPKGAGTDSFAVDRHLVAGDFDGANPRPRLAGFESDAAADRQNLVMALEGPPQLRTLLGGGRRIDGGLWRGSGIHRYGTENEKERRGFQEGFLPEKLAGTFR